MSPTPYTQAEVSRIIHHDVIPSFRLILRQHPISPLLPRYLIYPFVHIILPDRGRAARVRRRRWIFLLFYMQSTDFFHCPNNAVSPFAISYICRYVGRYGDSSIQEISSYAGGDETHDGEDHIPQWTSVSLSLRLNEDYVCT